LWIAVSRLNEAVCTMAKSRFRAACNWPIGPSVIDDRLRDCFENENENDYENEKENEVWCCRGFACKARLRRKGALLPRHSTTRHSQANALRRVRRSCRTVAKAWRKDRVVP